MEILSATLKKKWEQIFSFHSTDENKEIFKKCTEIWNGIKNKIETINGRKKGEYGKGFEKMKFDTDDNLPLKKPNKSAYVDNNC